MNTWPGLELIVPIPAVLVGGALAGERAGLG